MPLPHLDVPVVQAPMSGATTPAIVAAVSNAGGLGSLPVGYLEPERIPEQIAKVRALTDRPFAVNLFVDDAHEVDDALLERANERLRAYRDELGIAHPPPVRKHIDVRAQYAAVLAARPAVFSFTFGIPPPDVLAAARAAGIATVGTAKSVREARALEAAGVDAVCVQGFEAGGHHGPFVEPTIDANVGTLALTALAVSSVRVPVLAAGGIGDGRGVAAVLALGATAAQVGSAFILADESAIGAAYRRALQGPDNERTTLTNVFSGRFARGVRNRFIDEMTGAELAPYPEQHWLTRDLRDAAAKAERAEFLSLWAGQAVALAKPLPARRIVVLLMDEARAAAARAAALLG